MIQRIKEEVGVEPIATHDIQEGDSWKTEIVFSRELSTQEKNKLDSVMTDEPTKPPSTSKTILKIKDIWENRESFKESIGNLKFDVFFTESVVGSGKIDQIELHFKDDLTLVQKELVKVEYGKLIS